MSEFDSHKLEGVQAAVVRAIDECDPELFASLYEPAGALLPADGTVIRGRDAIAAFFKSWLADGFQTQTLEGVELTVGDAVAVEEGVAIAGYADGSSKRSNYIVVHVRQPDGTWLMHRDIWTPADGAA
jgi:uncharacterized protein (TIGR02246 family)